MIYLVWIRLRSWIKTAELQRVKSLSRTEHNTKDNGLMDLETVKASKNGQMVQDMMDPGRMTRPMAKENLSMLTEIYMKDGGLTIRPMEKEPTHMLMVPTTMESGSMTSSMAKVWSHGQMVPSMKENTLTVKRREKAN